MHENKKKTTKDVTVGTDFQISKQLPEGTQTPLQSCPKCQKIGVQNAN